MCLVELTMFLEDNKEIIEKYFNIEGCENSIYIRLDSIDELEGDIKKTIYFANKDFSIVQTEYNYNMNNNKLYIIEEWRVI